MKRINIALCYAIMIIILLITTITLASASSVTFVWDNPNDADLAAIHLYQKSEPFDPNNNIPDERIAPDPNYLVAEIADFETERYTLQDVLDGHFWWAVTATDTSGNESPYSNQVDALIDTVSPGRPGLDIEVIIRIRVIAP